MYDGKIKKQLLYVNGELENEVDHPEDEVGKGEKSIWIGILNEGYAQAWNGLIDEVRIWSIVLTEDEIKLSMDWRTPTRPTSWKSNDNMGTN